MPALPVPNTVEIKLLGIHEADPRESTFHYRHGGSNDPISTSDLLLLATNWWNNCGVPLRQCIDPNTSFISVTAQDIGRVGGAKNTYAITANSRGLRGNAPAPGNVNISLAKEVDVPLKGETGRFWVMDLWSSDVVDSIIQLGLQALLTTLMTALQVHLADSTRPYAPVVASKKHGVFHTVTAMRTDQTTDELITRLKGHKKHRKRRVAPA